MKLFRTVVAFFILILFSFFIAFGEMRSENWLEKFVSIFEQSDVKFNFYNMKSSIILDKGTNFSTAEDICIEIVKNLTVNTDELDVKKANNKIYVNYNTKNISISVIGVEKNLDGIYIFVDILQNKGYKSIENNYHILKKQLLKHSDNVMINVCMSGEYTKTLQNIKKADILNKILYNMYAEEIDRVEEENFISVNAYSNLLSENNIKYLNRDINLNIGFRYSEKEDKTLFYIATPIIKIDY